MADKSICPWKGKPVNKKKEPSQLEKDVEALYMEFDKTEPSLQLPKPTEEPEPATEKSA